jgi:hypothetical protein
VVLPGKLKAKVNSYPFRLSFRSAEVVSPPFLNGLAAAGAFYSAKDSALKANGRD